MNNSIFRGIEIIFRPEFCISCRSCEISCAVSKSKTRNLFTAIKENPSPLKRLTIGRSAEDEMIHHLRCLHCKDAKCIRACMFDAIFRDPETLTIVVDESKCKACQLCVKACDRGVLQIMKVKGKKPVVSKCNHCAEKDTGPECVRACPTNALVLSLASNHLSNNTETGWRPVNMENFTVESE